MVFNLVESVRGSDYLASTVQGILDFLNIPYTGTDSFGFAFGTDKFLTKNALKQAGIPTPHYQLFNTPNDMLSIDLRFPLISKLNEIHGGVEITKDSVSENEKHLRERLKYLIGTYKQPVVVEEFIAGREVTVFVLEGINRKVYMAEKVFNKPGEKYQFVTFDDQWTDMFPDSFKYEKYDDPILRDYVKRAFDLSKMRDYGKMDVRVDLSNRYYFIDANANCAFGPKEAGTAMGYILDLYGITFTEMLKRLMINTLKGPAVDDLPN
jgi:D-alanine-D-alanine ligase